MSLSKWFPDVSSLRDLGNSSKIPRWLLCTGAAATAGVLAGGVYLYTNPSLITSMQIRVIAQKAGFSLKYKQGSKHRYCYAERGALRSDQPSMVFISGLSGCKEDWLPLVKDMPNDLHIVLLDLPGQGQSSMPTDLKDASLFAYRDMIAEFVNLTDMNVIPMHMVGISMGASLVALYAAQYHKTVNRITLICPAIQCPIETEAWQEIATGANSSGDHPYTLDMNDKAFFKPERKPSTLWKHRCLQVKKRSKQDFYQTLRRRQFVELTDESKKFEEILSTINIPTQIIWGEDDEILHVSGASLLEELLSNVKRVDVLEECGHAVHLELPAPCSSMIRDFYNTTYMS